MVCCFGVSKVKHVGGATCVNLSLNPSFERCFFESLTLKGNLACLRLRAALINIR